MNQAQESHLARLKEEFASLVDAKYRAGAIEHRGELLALPPPAVLNLAIEEAIDQVVYLLSLKELMTRRTG